MEPLYYVMAILGCADGGEQCREERLATPQYTSYQACQEALDEQLVLNSDLAYPTIAAKCRANRPIMVSREAGPRG